MRINRSLDFARDDREDSRTLGFSQDDKTGPEGQHPVISGGGLKPESRNLPDRARKDKEAGILWLERLPVDNRAPESQLIGILEVIPEPQAAGQ